MPVIAVTAGGNPMVRDASSSAISGSKTGELTPAFVVAPVVMTATGVTSDPVPAVVGTRMSGSLEPSTWSTPYIDARDCVPANSTATTLATSIELPPPTATTPSTLCSRPSAAASATTESAGSAVTASKRTAPSAEEDSASKMGAINPAATNPGSVTSSTRFMPSCRQ